MTKYNDGYDDGDNDGNKDRNDDDNSAAGSVSDGTIFNQITTPRSCGGGSGKYCTMYMTHYASTCRTIYLPYKDHIKYVP